MAANKHTTNKHNANLQRQFLVGKKAVITLVRLIGISVTYLHIRLGCARFHQECHMNSENRWLDK